MKKVTKYEVSSLAELAKYFEEKARMARASMDDQCHDPWSKIADAWDEAAEIVSNLVITN